MKIRWDKIILWIFFSPVVALYVAVFTIFEAIEWLIKKSGFLKFLDKLRDLLLKIVYKNEKGGWGMNKEVKTAIELIEENNWVGSLRECRNIQERYCMLMKLFPALWNWNVMSSREIVFYLQLKHGLDFGVCPFYEIENNRQYCVINGEKIECTCAVPQPCCVLRDKNKN